MNEWYNTLPCGQTCLSLIIQEAIAYTALVITIMVGWA